MGSLQLQQNFLQHEIKICEKDEQSFQWNYEKLNYYGCWFVQEVFVINLLFTLCFDEADKSPKFKQPTSKQKVQSEPNWFHNNESRIICFRHSSYQNKACVWEGKGISEHILVGILGADVWLHMESTWWDFTTMHRKWKFGSSWYRAYWCVSSSSQLQHIHGRVCDRKGFTQPSVLCANQRHFIKYYLWRYSEHWALAGENVVRLNFLFCCIKMKIFIPSFICILLFMDQCLCVFCLFHNFYSSVYHHLCFHC